MNRMNEACIFVYGKPISRNRRSKRRHSEKKFPFVGTPMVIVDRPTMTNAPLLTMMNKACEFKDPSVEHIPIDFNKGEKQFVVGPRNDRFTHNGTIPECDYSSESPSPIYLEPTASDPKRDTQSPSDSKRMTSEPKRGLQSPSDSKRMNSDPKHGFQSPFDSKRTNSELSRGFQSPFDSKRMTSEPKRGFPSPFNSKRMTPELKRGFQSPIDSKRMTSERKRGSQSPFDSKRIASLKRGIRIEDSEIVSESDPTPDTDYLAAPRTRDMRSPAKLSRLTTDKQPRRKRRQSPMRPPGHPKLEPFSQRRQAAIVVPVTPTLGKSISPSPATHHIDMVNNDANSNVVKKESKTLEYHTADTSEIGTSFKSSAQYLYETMRRPTQPLILPNSPHLLKQLAKMDGVTSMKFSLKELTEPSARSPSPPVRQASTRTKHCQATPLPSHETFTNVIQKPRVDQYKSTTNFNADAQNVEKLPSKPIIELPSKPITTATNQTQYGNGMLPVNPVDDIKEYLTEKTLRELQTTTKLIQISDAPRVKVIAEKFIRFKKNNVEIRKVQEKVVCLEYDIFNEDHFEAPAEVMRAYFSIKMPCPKCEEEDLMIKEIPSHIRHKFHIAKEDISKSAVKQIEVIDETVKNNKTYLEDLKMILKRKKIMNEKRMKSSLDLMSMYEMAKKESPPFDYKFSGTNLLSKAELNELKALILQKCDSCNGVNRTGVKVSTSLKSESLMYDLLRSGIGLETSPVIPDIYKCFWNNQ